jgi:condensin complex subunit 2
LQYLIMVGRDVESSSIPNTQSLLSSQSERYAPLQEDEKEADRSIHKEAIERSRASQADLGGRSHMEETDDDSAGDYAAPDFGGGDDNDDDMDDGGMIGSFLNDGDSRLSSSSFAPERGSFQSTFEASQPPSQATFLLDAIAAGEISGSQSNYEYFNSQAFENMQGNMWAGAAHWKKGQSQRKTKLTADATPAKKKTASRANKQTAKVFVNLSTVPENLDDLLRQAPKGRRGVDPLQLSKAMKSKHSNVDNLLPLDVGIGINQLTCLFSRPNSTVAETVAPKPTKNVGFGNVQTVAFTSGGYDDEDSYGGDDNDGPGFDFGGDDNQEFVVQDLEGIRKVQKVQVGYATIAKKVDVKRLKSDLWTNLESVLKHKQLMVPKDDDDESGTEEDDEEDVNQVQPGTKRPTGPPSFQDTVRDMQATQSQADATLPFYFICVLHLANEKGLALESKGLEDFVIHGQ